MIVGSLSGKIMLVKKQLIAYCEKQFKRSRLAYFSAYKVFLQSYFQHIIEDDYVTSDVDYLYTVSIQHFKQLVEHREGKLSIHVETVNVERKYVQQFTRILLAYPDTHFAVESLRSALTRMHCHVSQNIVMANFSVQKSQRAICIEPSSNGETFVWFDVENHNDVPEQEIIAELKRVMADVKSVVRDWRKMQETLQGIIDAWRSTPESLAKPEQVKMYIDFMKWVLEDFAFLGYQGYRYTGKKRLALPNKYGLCAKKDASRYRLDIKDFPSQLKDEKNPLLLITQTNDRSTVHRTTYKDLLVLRVYCPQKKHWVEEHYFTGLFTADVFVADPSRMPLIREKFAEALSVPEFRSRYAMRRMEYILKSLPREELFHRDSVSLGELGHQILAIQGRRVVRLFIRKDVCCQFYSVMIYIPRTQFTTRLRRRVEDALRVALNGSDIEYEPFFSDSILTRMHFNVRSTACSEPNMPIEELEAKLQKICESWDDQLYLSLLERLGQKEGYHLAKRYTYALSDQYRNTYPAAVAAKDILLIETLENKAIDLRVVVHKNCVEFRVFQKESKAPASLKEMFPLLAHYGFSVESERHFEESLKIGCVSISEYQCQLRYPSIVNVDDLKEALRDAILQAIARKEHNDNLSSLLVVAGIGEKDINVIRALCTYLHQIKFPLSSERLYQFFIDYPLFAQAVVKVFQVKFQPKIVQREQLYKRHHRSLAGFVETVETSDEERIVREIMSVLDAIVRTNYYLLEQRALVFKIASSKIASIPKPSPLFEFFVYSKRFMGVHLRFNRVSRGGIRHSDRLDDVRHEVFELAKTQRLKNTLILPDGGKGGFVCKRLGKDCSPEPEEVLSCYQLFIRSMLSLVDNRLNGKVHRDKQMVIYDDDDPYFVVAADKGTATFSSYANEIALELGYWLGDAFASGGKNGYDHKKMGITAKGAWESVKWHFLAKKRSVYDAPFTVVGIGDMSGDVFGNGMLLSDKICLIAAFGYARIFIDPNPDPKISYQERLRLFQMPRSTWDDYNTTLISSGGGVFSRSSKYIDLSSQMKRMFSTNKPKMTPSEMIQAILTLQVDLLWNGGIGVYVKSSEESHYDVSDFHNDEYRIDANQLKAMVVGEGGNNGFTQLARIEYAKKGGLLNTDFIDNSAGVNTSDVEVNFKVLFQAVLAKKKLTLAKRNQMLAKMSHTVSEKVLKNNFLQNVQIDLTALEAQKRPASYIRFIEVLENLKLLDREIEKIPSKQELLTRKKNGTLLMRPEIAVLLSYSKIALHDDLMQLSLSSQPLTEPFLYGYFPKNLAKRYAQDIGCFSLREELVATELSNAMISEAGVLFVSQLQDDCNVDTKTIVNAYLVVRTALNLGELYPVIYQNAARMDQEVFLYLLGSMQRAIYKACRWLIRYHDVSKPEKLLEAFNGIAEFPPLLEQFPRKYTQRMLRIKDALIAAGMQKKQASLICEARYFYQHFGLQSVANQTKFTIKEVLPVYYQIARTIRFHKVKERLDSVQMQSRWDSIQRATIDDDFGKLLESLTIVVLQYADKEQLKTEDAFSEWTKANHTLYAEVRRLFSEIIEQRQMDLSVFIVVLSRIKSYLFK